jgi:hypothetical protein
MTLVDRYAAELRQAAGPRHEFQLRVHGQQLMVTCACLLHHGRGPGHTRREPIEMRRSFPAAEAIAAYRSWHASRGIEVRS